MELELSEKDQKQVSKFLKKKFPKRMPTTQEVIELAADEASPLHGYFEWDNRQAAEKYRIIQAKVLIKIVVIEDYRASRPAPQYLQIQSHDEESSYFSDEESEDSLFDQVIPKAVTELKHWKDKYQDYPQFAQVVEAINQIEKELENDKEKAKDSHE